MIRLLVGALLGASVTLGLTCAHLGPDGAPYEALVARLGAEEGFKPLPYRDTRGILTVAYGRNLTVPFTRTEGRYLLVSMLERNAHALAARWRAFAGLPLPVREALVDLAYVVGPTGALKFTHMIRDLEAGDYGGAADEILNSQFAKQDPNRAKRIANAIRQSSQPHE